MYSVVKHGQQESQKSEPIRVLLSHVRSQTMKIVSLRSGGLATAMAFKLRVQSQQIIREILNILC